MLAVGEINKVLDQLRSSKEIYEMSIEMSHGLDPVALYLYDEAKSPKKVSLGFSLERDAPHLLNSQAFASNPGTPVSTSNNNNSTPSLAPLTRSSGPPIQPPPQVPNQAASMIVRPSISIPNPAPAPFGNETNRITRAPTRSQPPVPARVPGGTASSLHSRPAPVPRDTQHVNPPQVTQAIPPQVTQTVAATSSPPAAASAPFEIIKIKNFSSQSDTKSNLSALIGPLNKAKILTLNIWMEGRAVPVKISEKSSIAQLFTLLKNQEIAFGVFDDLDTCLLFAASPTGQPLPAPDSTPLPPTSNLPLTSIPAKDLVLLDSNVPTAENPAPEASTNRHNSIFDPNSTGGANLGQLKICLPADQYQVVAFTADMTVRVLLRRVCEKRQLDTVGHYFYLKKDKVEERLPGNMLVKDIKGKEIWLGQGGEEGDEGKGQGPIRFWSEAEAFRHKQYNVTKMKKIWRKTRKSNGNRQ